jgi:hypothetical protein
MTALDRIISLSRYFFAKEDLFYADIREDWGSQNPDHRLLIRKGILEYLKLSYPDQLSDSLWDLETPPVLKNLFVSISHSDGMGGFILSNKSIGLDIEKTIRLTEALVSRVSTPEEIQSCPDPKLLWTCKEAVFKCSPQFYTISHVHIDQWTVSEAQTPAFSSLTAKGWAFHDQDHTYAVAIKK